MSEEVKYCKRGHPRTPENVNSSGRCILCQRERQKRYVEKNINRVKEIRKNYYSKNAEREKERSKKYRLGHREEIKKRKLCWNKRYAISLQDGYICSVMGLKIGDLSIDIIELKRLQLQLKREVKKCKHPLTQ